MVDLRRKIDGNYSSPNIITVIEESDFSIFDEDSECSTFIMVHKDYYNIPKGKDCSHIFRKTDIHYSGLSLSTLSECGRYSDYYVILVS